MLPFFRLIRIVNMLIIIITMLGVVDYCVKGPITFSEHANFWILIFTTLLIAAGGNIINDYFDLRADRINRPQSVVIGKYIKRRWAIVLHWLFNFLGILGGIYFLWKFGEWGILLIHFITTGVLWWYSVWLKKIPLIGNLVIASLIVLVILMTLYYLTFGFSNFPYNQYDENFGTLYLYRLQVIYWFAVIGFTLNIAREIVKDTEDIKGDEAIHAKTIPMIIGTPLTLRLVGLIMLIYPVIFFVGIAMHIDTVHMQKLWPLTLAAIVCLMGIFPLFQPNEKWIVTIKQALKIAMVLGLLYLFL